ncbi:MAG: DUF423 domain-containing protein [Verrucomicrobia bacterium]|nr:DUF423 domain-containing protein [Verrucomicrobiota bacterium]
MTHRTSLLAAALVGVTGVALGAFGAHALKAFLLERGMLNAWDTAARYQMLHAVALFGAAVWLRTATGSASRWIGRAAACWTAGVVLFCGSLYALAGGGPNWLGPITPLGGLAFMLGWLLLGVAAVAQESPALSAK